MKFKNMLTFGIENHMPECEATVKKIKFLVFFFRREKNYWYKYLFQHKYFKKLVWKYILQKKNLP